MEFINNKSLKVWSNKIINLRAMIYDLKQHKMLYEQTLKIVKKNSLLKFRIFILAHFSTFSALSQKIKQPFQQFICGTNLSVSFLEQKYIKS